MCADLELGVSAKKRGDKKKGPKRKTRAMLEAERRGPITFASLLEMAGDAGAPLTGSQKGWLACKVALHVQILHRSLPTCSMLSSDC